MAERGRHLNTGGGQERPAGPRDDMAWLDDMDWLEETPAPAPRRAAGQTGGRTAPPQSQSRPRQPQWDDEDLFDDEDWDLTVRDPVPQQQRRPVQQPTQQQRRPVQQSTQQQRRPVQQPTQQQRRPVQQPMQQQRKPVQQPTQQQRRPVQQPTQQQRRPVQQPTQQQRRPVQQPTQQRRPAQQPRQAARSASMEPWRDKPSRSGRYVAVEPEDYRSKTSRGAKKGNTLLIVLVVVLVVGVLISGGILGSALLNYHRDRSAYNALADEALSGLAEPNATTAPGEDPNAGAQQQVQSEAPFAVNWEYLRSVNSDVVGWIYCAGTQINYPVVQTTDNEYYLHRDFTSQQPNTAGTLFTDPNAALGVIYSNYIIYGHNMKDGSMFATIESYVSQDFYEQHPVMYFLTPDQNYRIDLIAGRIVESTLDNYPGYFSDADYGGYLNDITSHSFFVSHAGVSTNYQLITLSTCDYSGGYRDPRFLLQGLLVPIQ